MTEQTVITLADGHKIPQVGFGVWKITDNNSVDIVKGALEAGYRHVDTAQVYGNEAEVGEAVAASDVAREDIFVTSKLRTSHFPKDKAIPSFEESLQRLGMDYVDLFLLHWPVPGHDGLFVEAWESLIKLQKAGKIRSIGVSNFLPEHILELEEKTGVLPAVNQLELHPHYQQRDVRDFHKQKNIAIQSYSPLGSGAVFGDPKLEEIAAAKGKSVAQIIIRWHIQEGLIVLPKSATPSRVISNLDVFGFELDESDMAAIAALDRTDGKTLPEPADMNNLF